MTKIKNKKTSRKTVERIKTINNFLQPVNEYLHNIGYEARLKEDKYFTDEELKNLLIKNIRDYIEGKVSQNFIVGLGSTIYEEAIVGEGDETLLTACCKLDDLMNELFSDGENKKTIEEINGIIKNLYELLTTSHSIPQKKLVHA